MQRADHCASGFLVLSAAFCGAVRRIGARFSVTVNAAAKITAAIAAIGETAWTAIRYPRAIWDD